jgi:hypothetical protein
LGRDVGKVPGPNQAKPNQASAGFEHARELLLLLLSLAAALSTLAALERLVTAASKNFQVSPGAHLFPLESLGSGWWGPPWLIQVTGALEQV